MHKLYDSFFANNCIIDVWIYCEKKMSRNQHKKSHKDLMIFYYFLGGGRVGGGGRG